MCVKLIYALNSELTGCNGILCVVQGGLHLGASFYIVECFYML